MLAIGGIPQACVDLKDCRRSYLRFECDRLGCTELGPVAQERDRAPRTRGIVVVAHGYAFFGGIGNATVLAFQRNTGAFAFEYDFDLTRLPVRQEAHMAVAIVVQIDQYAVARHDADIFQRHGIGRLRRRGIRGGGHADVGGPCVEKLARRQVQVGAIKSRPRATDRERFGRHSAVCLYRRIGARSIRKGICGCRHGISSFANRKRCMDLNFISNVGKYLSRPIWFYV